MHRRDGLRGFIGRDVDVDERSGVSHRGRLLDVSRHSLWLVEGNEDCFIPLTSVEDLRAASS